MPGTPIAYLAIPVYTDVAENDSGGKYLSCMYVILTQVENAIESGTHSVPLSKNFASSPSEDVGAAVEHKWVN